MKNGNDRGFSGSEETLETAAACAGSGAVAVANGVLRTIDRTVLALNRVLMIAALGAMSVIVFVNVMLRYLTDDSIVWSEEVARYLMIWLTFLGVGPVMRLGGHVAIDTLHHAVSAQAARALRTVVVGLLTAFCLTLGWFGAAFVGRSWGQTTPVTEIPFSFVSAAVPTGFVLALWHLFAVARGYVKDASFETSPDLNPEEAGSA